MFVRVVFLVVFFSFVVVGNHFAYLALYNGDCEEQTVAVTPIFPGEGKFCYVAGAGSCVSSLRGWTDSDTCSTISHESINSTSLQVNYEGNSQVIQYGNCFESPVYGGCFAQYIRKDLYFLDNDDDGKELNEPDLIGFLTFTEDTCHSYVQWKAPIFAGEVSFCYDRTQSVCAGVVGGFTMFDEDDDKQCELYEVQQGDACYFTQTELDGDSDRILFGYCGTSTIYPGCKLMYSKTTGQGRRCDDLIPEVSAPYSPLVFSSGPILVTQLSLLLFMVVIV